MLKEILEKEYYGLFTSSQNPFLTREFYLLNKDKVQEVKFLINDEAKPSIGIVLGIADNKLLSPYSAPFGGIHFSHSNIYIDKIEEFAENLKAYFTLNKYDFFKCTFPPTIYGASFNHKMINAMARKGFKLETPELTSYVDLDDFNFRFGQKNSREYYSQALRNKLVFKQVFDAEGHNDIVNLIKDNRERSNRKLRMSLEDFKKIETIWDVNYFGVFDEENQMAAAAIFYLFPNDKLAFTALWGDSLTGRGLRGMDFLSFESWSHFKKKEFKYVDLGISTEEGAVPNLGLLRFKETHEAKTELRFTLTLTS
jgi:hypothetical protein